MAFTTVRDLNFLSVDVKTEFLFGLVSLQGLSRSRVLGEIRGELFLLGNAYLTRCRGCNLQAKSVTFPVWNSLILRSLTCVQQNKCSSVWFGDNVGLFTVPFQCELPHQEKAAQGTADRGPRDLLTS